MQTVLITGVTGFLGQYVAYHFAQAGWRVVGVGTKSIDDAPHHNLSHYQQMHLPSLALETLVQSQKPRLCVHCAGRSSVELSLREPLADFQASVPVTFHVLDILRQHAPTCHLIYLSSAAVYGNPAVLPISESAPPKPLSPYGFHKLLGEQLCTEFHQLYGLPTTILRIFSAYGPGLRRQVMWDMCQKALTQPLLSLRGTGEESRDFIHGQDVARVIHHLATSAPGKAEIYNLASGVETTIQVLAQLTLSALGRDIPIEFDGVIPAGTPRNWQADMTRLQGLGWKPRVPLARGVEGFAEWCRAEVMEW
ncbi:MAG: SDR family oxidoreductase [Ardenticatenales bacterium]|nr:SDR family oxidoreductase [Ardenticatenales bacterium]